LGCLEQPSAAHSLLTTSTIPSALCAAQNTPRGSPA